MIARSAGILFALTTLAMTGCNRAIEDVSWTGSAENEVAANGMTSEGGHPVPQSDDGTIASQRILQKPVSTIKPAEKHTIQSAICVLQPVGESGVTGEIRMQPTDDGVRIHGSVKGLSPGKHGFHVHEFGDVSDTQEGSSAGGHFNPSNQEHGHREDEKRHAGDFGNIEADAQGVAKIDFVDPIVQLNGSDSVVGRAIVVHASEDKFTQPSGDAGPRVAFGVIGIAGQVK